MTWWKWDLEKWTPTFFYPLEAKIKQKYCCYFFTVQLYKGHSICFSLIKRARFTVWCLLVETIWLNIATNIYLGKINPTITFWNWSQIGWNFDAYSFALSSGRSRYQCSSLMILFSSSSSCFFVSASSPLCINYRTKKVIRYCKQEKKP